MNSGMHRQIIVWREGPATGIDRDMVREASDTLGDGIRIERLIGTADAFAPFAFPQSRARLACIDMPFVAIGACWHGTPIGLALARMMPGHASLESVMVAPWLRRSGIGRRLMESIAAEAHAEGAATIETRYSGLLKARAPLEALLASTGWSTPTVADIQLVGLPSVMVPEVGRWGPVRRAMQGNSGYCTTPFDIRSDDDNAAFDAILSAPPKLRIEDPRQTDNLDLEISMVLRHRGVLIGWIAAERITRSIGRRTFDPDTVSIYYSSARFAEGHNKALMLLGYHTAFSRQLALHGPSSRAVYRTYPAAAAMYAFTRTRFAQIALHIEEHLVAHRVLNPDAGASTTVA